jgi:hypothetical protein
VTPPALTPHPTLADVLGPGVAYVPRRSPNLHGWSPPAAGHIDFQTGLQLGVAGGVPYVVCAATVTAESLAVYAEAGVPVTTTLHVYRSSREYLELLSRLTGQGLHLASQRVHPDEEIPPGASFVAPSLLRSLNDKGRMEGIVPPEWLPSRRTITVAELPAGLSLVAHGRPVVLKAATELPSGGGHGVWICRTAEAVERARAALATERRVVVEEFLEIARSVCVHAVVYPDGSSALIGVAEEVCRAGRWLGNWHDALSDNVPQSVLDVVAGIVASASTLGYRGIVGIDVALLEDGPPRVLDLNFRVNGSTAGAWLRASIEPTRGMSTIRGRTWTGRHGFAAMLRVVRAAVGRGTLIPLSLYDPGACEMGGAARVGGLLLGGSRAEVEEEERRLAAEGLD